MTDRDAERLREILEAVSAIRRHAASDSPAETAGDAILYRLVGIGEAVQALSDEVKQRAPKVPWSDIVRMRNILTHAYFQIDATIISAVVDRDLGQLETEVRSLLKGNADTV